MADGAAGEGAVERILRMVSEGKVTPEQGAELLRALPKDAGSGDAGAAASDEAEPGRGEPRGVFGGDGRRFGGAEGMGFDLTQLGRIGRQVARRVERELDNLERSARKGWFDAEDGDERSEELLWQGPAPAGGVLALDIEVENAGVRVETEPEASEVRVAYQQGVLTGIGDTSMPRVRMDGDRLVVRQHHRSVMIGLAIRSERLVVRLPRSVRSVTGMVHSRNGSVRVEGLDIGRLEVRAVNGGCRVRADRADELEVHSANGRVEAVVGRGDVVRASSRNGKVEVEGTVRRLDADAGNGKIDARVGAPAADSTWRLNAGNGKVQVVLPPPPSGVHAQVRSAVGGVDVDLSTAVVRWLGRGPVGAEAEVAREARDGAPTLTLEAKATNGHITLAEPAAAGADAASAPAP